MDDLDARLQAFEAAYAQRSNMTVVSLHQHGLFAVPCECGESDCEGFAMAHATDPETYTGQRGS